MTLAQDGAWRQRMERLNTLLAQVDEIHEAQTRGRMRELVRLIMDLHGAALERVLERLAASGAVGMEVIDAMADDDLVSGVLLLYGLHPLDLDTRVRQALDKIRPALSTHGGGIELMHIRDGTVRLRLQGNGDACPSTTATLRKTIEGAIYEKAPDVTAIEVLQADGVTPVPGAEVADHTRAAGVVPLQVISR